MAQWLRSVKATSCVQLSTRRHEYMLNLLLIKEAAKSFLESFGSLRAYFMRIRDYETSLGSKVGTVRLVGWFGCTTILFVPFSLTQWGCDFIFPKYCGRPVCITMINVWCCHIPLLRCFVVHSKVIFDWEVHSFDLCNDNSPRRPYHYLDSRLCQSEVFVSSLEWIWIHASEAFMASHEALIMLFLVFLVSKSCRLRSWAVLCIVSVLFVLILALPSPII
jgi:hypothetical protein